jgi:hypothetical protein
MKVSFEGAGGSFSSYMEEARGKKQEARSNRWSFTAMYHTCCT